MASISFIGSGKLALQLGTAFKNKGHRIAEVWNRDADRAKALAEKLEARSADQLSKIGDADFYILALPDDVIQELGAQLPVGQGLVIHTSGSTPSDPFPAFWPIASLSDEETLSFDAVPICLSAGDELQLSELRELGQSISSNVFELSDTQRLKLHLAAVLTNNFAFYLLREAQALVKAEGLDWSTLEPLLQQTLKSVKDPASKQTGPAARGDRGTIQKHLALLNSNDLRDLYELFSDHIQKKQ